MTATLANFGFIKTGSSFDYDRQMAIYNLPKSWADKAFSGEIIVDLKNVSGRGKTFIYEESFNNQFMALIHLSAVRNLMTQERLNVFSLFYEPIFDVSYKCGWVFLSRSGYKFQIEKDYIFAQMASCIDDIIAMSDPSLALPHLLQSEIARVEKENIAFGFAC